MPQKEWIVAMRAESSSRTVREPVVDLLLGGVEQPLGAGRANPLPHLAGGPLGKGNGRQLIEAVGTAGPGGVEAGDEPLGEHEGLAAARPGRQRDRYVAGVDGAGLLFSEFRHGQGLGKGNHEVHKRREEYDKKIDDKKMKFTPFLPSSCHQSSCHSPVFLFRVFRVFRGFSCGFTEPAAAMFFPATGLG